MKNNNDKLHPRFANLSKSDLKDLEPKIGELSVPDEIRNSYEIDLEKEPKLCDCQPMKDLNNVPDNDCYPSELLLFNEDDEVTPHRLLEYCLLRYRRVTNQKIDMKGEMNVEERIDEFDSHIDEVMMHCSNIKGILSAAKKNDGFDFGVVDEEDQDRNVCDNCGKVLKGDKN